MKFSLTTLPLDVDKIMLKANIVFKEKGLTTKILGQIHDGYIMEMPLQEMSPVSEILKEFLLPHFSTISYSKIE